MLLTTAFFYKDNCSSSIIKFLSEDQTKHQITTDKLDLYEWLNYHISHLMNYKQSIQYSVYAAELVFHIFEKKHPSDDRYRNCIESARKCIEDPSGENKSSAYENYSSISYSYGDDKDFRYSSGAYAALVAYDTISDDWPVGIYSYSAAKYAIDISNNDKKIMNKIIDYGLELLEGL